MIPIKDIEHLKLYVYTAREHVDPTVTRMPYMIEKIYNFLIDVGLKNTMIVEINGYETENKKEEISNTIDLFENSDNIILCTKAYVSKYEFQGDKYYNPNLHEPVAGRKPIPFEEVLARESKMLKELGFIDISKWIGERKRTISFMYPNNLGEIIIDGLRLE